MKAVSNFQSNTKTTHRLSAAMVAFTILFGSTASVAANKANMPSVKGLTFGQVDTPNVDGAVPKTNLAPGIKGLPDTVHLVPAGSNPVNQIPTFDIPQNAQTIDKVQKLENDGEKYFNQHLMDKAMATWQESYGLSIEMKFAEGQGRALTNMCRVYLERGDYTKAKYMGENAIEVLAESSDKRSLGKARVQLARAYFGLDNPTWAATQLEEALRLLTANDGQGNPAEAADALMLAGSIVTRIKKMKEALQFYEAAANYYAQAGDYQRSVSTHITVASYMDEFGLYQAAVEEAQKALSVARTSEKDLSLQVGALASLGMAQYDLCEYANARKTYEDALRVVQKTKLNEVSNTPRAYIDLGYGCTLAATGDLDAARTVLERTMQPLKVAGSKHGQAEALNVLGVIEELQGNYGKSIAFLQQSLDMQNIITPRQPKLNIIVLQNIAAAEAKAGDNRQAKMHLELALNQLKGFPSELLAARTYSSLAEICIKLSDPAKAQDYLKKAIEVGEKVDDDASLWRDYTLQAKLQINDGQGAEVKESLASALSHFRSPQAGAFSTPERLSFPSSREDLGEQLVAMVAKTGNGEQALLTAEQLKEESFNNEWHRRDGQVRAEDKDTYVDLTMTRAHLHAAEASDDPKNMVKDWQDWMVRFRTVVADNRPLARLIAPIPNTVQDVLKAVKRSNSTIMEYLVGADSSVVFSIDPSGRITATVLAVTRKQLQSQITALLATALSAQDAPKARPLLTALYNELVPNSLQNFLPKSPDSTIAVIPDGVLFNLPFAALVDPQGKYFIEQHTLTMASSVSMFLDSPPKYAGEFSMLVASSPNTANEANALTQANQGKMLTSPADLGALTEQSRGKSTVHFASNLQLLSNPLSSQLPVAGNDRARNVTASKLFATTLANDLVVLSGTTINTRDVQGSAVKLLSRGLNYAGARNVLMSLWFEPDADRTSELLEFYRNEQSGMTQAQSLRKAQMVALSRDPSPRSWAAFQLVGPGF